MNSTKALFVALCVTALAVTVGSTAQAAEGPLKDELNNYWAVDRDLPVIEDKMHKRAGRFGVGLFAGMLSSEPYYWYIPVGGRVSYFFTDQLGVEVGGAFMDAKDILANTTDIHDFLENSLGEAFDPTTDLEDRFLWRANATFIWNPLYGKWSFLNNKLSHFDFNLALGGGVVSVERPALNRAAATTEIVPELVLGTGIHFLFGDNWTVRADGRFYVYQGAETTSNEGDFFKQLDVPAEFLLGVTYMF